VQHALTRGLEVAFQLEEGEVISEPTPSRENRRAILVVEATEGGAGVLNRLIAEPDRVALVARTALDLMHLENIDEAVASGDSALLRDKEGAECVKGCYRCLLSYYNQPDHELIDRTNVEARALLLRLACSTVEQAGDRQAAQDPWAESLKRWGLPAPDVEPLTVGHVVLPLVWRSHLVAAVIGAFREDDRSAVRAKGFEIVDFAPEPGDAAPEGLGALLGG